MVATRILFINILFLLAFTNVIAQDIKLKKGIELDSALQKIAKVYKVNFAYNSTEIEGSYLINQDITIKSAKEFLKLALPDLFQWNYVGNTIVISRKNDEGLLNSNNPREGQLPLKSDVSLNINSADPRSVKLNKVRPINTTKVINSNIVIPEDVNFPSFISTLPYDQKEELQSIDRVKDVIWEFRPFFAAAKQSRSFFEKRIASFNTGVGLNVNAIKRNWYLSSSLSYHYLLKSSVTGNTIINDSTRNIEDSLNLSVENRTPIYVLPNSFLRYTTGVGYKVMESSRVEIPIELGVSALQNLGNIGSNYNRFLYNAYIALQIELFLSRKSLTISSFAEISLNNDFQEIKFTSNRSTIGFMVGINL